MSKKRFSDFNSNSSDTPSFFSQLKNDLGFVYEKKTNAVKAIMLKYPYKTAIIMFVIVALNFVVMLYYTNRNKGGKENLYSSMIKEFDFKKAQESNKIPFTFSNYRMMKSYKDSLEYLFSKKDNMTKYDTLLFLRLAHNMQKLDPDFFKLKSKK